MMYENSSGAILSFRSNAQLDDDAQKQRELAADTEPSHPVSRLAQHCREEWQRARETKQPIERRMNKALRARQGLYSEDKLQAIRQHGGSEIKMHLTDVKVRAVRAWIEDVILNSGERPFSCEPTPIPEIPPEIQAQIEREAYLDLKMVEGLMPHPRDLRERIDEVTDAVRKEAMDQAKRMAERMEDKIDDEYLHGQFYEAMPDFIDDFCTHPAAILKGPVVHKKKALSWMHSNDPVRPNALKPLVQQKLQRTFYAPSPYDIYLTPEAKNSEQGSLIERHRLSAADLYEFLGTPGYDDEQINAALDAYADAGYRDWLWNDAERAKLENREHETILADGNLIDALEVWTRVKGGWLREWGMDGIEDDNRWYNACCWLVGHYVIRATLNDDPLGLRPYHMACYVPTRNSPWGKAPPEIMEDLQNMCDAAARSISNNMGMASGPMVEVESDRLAQGERVTTVEPWRVYQTVANKFGTPAPAIRYHQPPIVVDALMRVFEFFSQLADEYTGIPRYQYGDSNIGGAGETAAGLSMLMNASGRLMKGVIRNLDRAIIRCTEFTHRHIMLFDDDFEAKGDVAVKANATQAILHREAQQMRLKETLDATRNPMDFAIMGPQGRLELLRGALRHMEGVDVEKVLPSNDRMLMQAFAANMQPPQGQPTKEGQEPRPQENIEGMAA